MPGFNLLTGYTLLERTDRVTCHWAGIPAKRRGRQALQHQPGYISSKADGRAAIFLTRAPPGRPGREVGPGQPVPETRARKQLAKAVKKKEGI